MTGFENKIVSMISFVREKFVQNMLRVVQYFREEVVIQISLGYLLVTPSSLIAFMQTTWPYWFSHPPPSPLVCPPSVKPLPL